MGRETIERRTEGNELKEIKKINKNAIATIHNNLIQARHRLSLEELRLMDTIISFIQPDDEDFKRYKIPVSVFKDLYNIQRKDIYDVVKRAVEGLLSKPIKIEEVEEGKRRFKMFNFISFGEYEEGAGNFYIEIDRNFKPYLLQLKEFFTRIPIKYTYVLNSKYAIRLYELLKQYEETGYRVDYLSDLREMLGVEPGEYSRFEAFERRVLKKAIEEINDKTDLKVSYSKKKTGRKVTHIEFIIEKKEINRYAQLVQSPAERVWQEIGDLREKYWDILNDVVSYLNRLNENQVLFLLVNLDTSLYPLEAAIEIIKNADKNKRLTNPMGFLIRSFQIDMNRAKYKELTLIPKKLDKELFVQRLEDGKEKEKLKPAKEIMEPLIYLLEKSVSENTLNLLKEPLLDALIDKEEKIVYIPVPDEVYKEWIEKNYLQSIKSFLNMNFGVNDIVLKVMESEDLLEEKT